jgi:uncharacterized protein YegJ (DUF2314 family)
MARYSTAATLVIVVLVIGCGKGWPRDKVTMVADDDPRMNAAILEAKKTVKTFIAALQHPRAGQHDFTVKKPFKDGKRTEHMWLAPVRFDGKNFRGTVNNDPDAVSNVKIGDQATVDPESISDWMFVDNGKLVGGYTLRVLRDAMPAAEREEFDKSVPFKIE